MKQFHMRIGLTRIHIPTPRFGGERKESEEEYFISEERGRIEKTREQDGGRLNPIPHVVR
jgi:hypothetical protein